MPTYVIDTSVLLKWFNQENESKVDIAHQIYQQMITGDIVLIAPSLLAIELINVLTKGKRLAPVEIKKSLDRLFSLPLMIKEPNQKTLEQSIDLANRYSLAAYDALFVALAVEENCKLISDDAKGHGKIIDGSVLMLKDYK